MLLELRVCQLGVIEDVSVLLEPGMGPEPGGQPVDPALGIDPRFVGLPRELLVERAATERGEEVPRVAVGGLMAAPDLCAAGCCPNPRGEQPVIGGPQSPPRLVR